MHKLPSSPGVGVGYQLGYVGLQGGVASELASLAWAAEDQQEPIFSWQPGTFHHSGFDL